jgi:hypothetical protein
VPEDRRTGPLPGGPCPGRSVEKDVTLVDAGEEINDAVDEAYRAKYGHCAAYIIKAITSPEASSTTMRLLPR